MRRLLLPLLLLLAASACPEPPGLSPAPDDDDDTVTGDDDDAATDDDDATSDDDDDATGDDDDDATPFVCTADDYEPNDTEADATVVTFPFDESGLTLCDDDPADWFEMAGLLVSGFIEVSASYEEIGSDLDLELFGPDGDVVAISEGGGTTEWIQHYVAFPGTYRLRVYASAPGDVPGNLYNLQIQVNQAPTFCEPDALEPNDTEADAPSLSTTTYLNLTACGDDDWYAVEAIVGDDLVFDVQFFAVEGNVDLTLFDPSGNFVALADSNTDDELIEHTAAESGDYLLQVALTGDGGFIPGLIYSLTVDGATQGCTSDVYEPNNEVATAAYLSGGIYLSQTICPGDDDWYALDLTAGHVLTYDLGYIAAEGNIDVFLWDHYLTTNYASGETTDNDENFVILVPETGPYVLHVTMPSGDAGSLPGNVYDMDVSSVIQGVCPIDFFEPNDDINMAAYLPSLGLYPAMQVCVDEPDFFSFYAFGDQLIDIDVDFDETDGDITLELYDPGGVLFATADTDGAPEIISTTAVDGGNYTLGVILSEDLGVNDGVDYDVLLTILSPE